MHGDERLQTPQGIAGAADGSLYVIGAFEGTLDLGGGPLDNPSANFVHDVFLTKLGPDGAHVWSKQYGNQPDDQDGYGVAVDSDGNVIATGKFRGPIDFGGGELVEDQQEDVFVAKLSPAGDALWARQYGDGYWQTARAVAAGKAGEIALVGEYEGTLDLGTGPLPSKAGVEAFVAMLSPDGDALWSRGFGGPSADHAYAVAVDGAGNLIVAGCVYGVVDFGGGETAGASDLDAFVASYAPGGGLAWVRRFGDGAEQCANAVAVDGAGTGRRRRRVRRHHRHRRTGGDDRRRPRRLRREARAGRRSHLAPDVRRHRPRAARLRRGRRRLWRRPRLRAVRRHPHLRRAGSPPTASRTSSWPGSRLELAAAPPCRLATIRVAALVERAAGSWTTGRPPAGGACAREWGPSPNSLRRRAARAAGARTSGPLPTHVLGPPGRRAASSRLAGPVRTRARGGTEPRYCAATTTTPTTTSSIPSTIRGASSSSKMSFAATGTTT